jgi:hypothetical protein
MNSITRSGVSRRPLSAALWVLAIAGAMMWLAGFAYELRTLPPQLSASSAQPVSVSAARAAAHEAQTDEPLEHYWVQVGRAAGAL